MPSKKITPSRQIERSIEMIAKQRAALKAPDLPSHLIKRPVGMKGEESRRRLDILQRHEILLSESWLRYMTSER